VGILVEFERERNIGIKWKVVSNLRKMLVSRRELL